MRFGLEPDDTGAEEDTSPPTASVDELMERPGVKIGRYKLLRVLGAGGMGVVYLAQQDKPVTRQVALKVIKPGMDSKRVMARFEAEEQALALMEHPHVARVYDAGLTGSGRPHFVMEYVKGIPIAEHCDKYKLTIEERLRLFVDVCEAVQHAHQKGIIHRDLKPSNILVSIDGNESIPKVIDFGVARAVSQQLTENTLYTEQGQLIGTPEYMSPEQADLNNQDIDTRTDIYALGVVLYRLLAGVPPFDPQALQAAGIEHMRKVTCEEEPKTPSTRLSKTSVQESTESARRRNTSVRALQRRLHGDLDWITLKAMEKNRTRRYGSAGELAADIERHLNHEAVLAGPPSTIYRLEKFARRNRALVTGATAVVAALIVGAVVSIVFAIGQVRARTNAQEVTDFPVNSTLGSFNTWKAKGTQVTARSVLDTVAQNLEEKLIDQPLVQARIHQALVPCYAFLGFYNEAEQHQKRSLEIRRSYLGGENVDTLSAMFALAWVYYMQVKHWDEAERLATEALTGFERILPEEDPRRLLCLETLGWVHIMRSRFDEAEQIFQRVLRTIHQKLGNETEWVPVFMCWLALTHQMQGDYEKAETQFVKGLEISRRLRGERDVATLSLLHCYGVLLCDQGHYKEAEKILDDALKGRLYLFGEQHPSTLDTKASLGWLYEKQGRYKAAEDLLSTTLQATQRIFGETHFRTWHCVHGLGTVYLSQRRYDEAEPLLNKAVEIGSRILSRNNWATLSAMNTLAKLYTEHGRYADAEELYLETIRTQRHVLGNEHPHTLATINDFAMLLTRQKHYDDAGPLLLEALEGRRLKLGDTHRHTIESWNTLINLYEAWNKPEKAKEWRAERAQIEDLRE